MNASELARKAGHSLWLDNITRELLNSGKLASYIDGYSIAGLTSNPAIFEEAFRSSASYDEAILAADATVSSEALFFELALEDLVRAADLFRPIYEKTNGIDGWVSIEVSPLLAFDPAGTLGAAKELFARARRPNVFIKIPGNRHGLEAITEATAAGIPVNITLLFSPEQYEAAADAYLRGIERRIDHGLNPQVPSVASVFISRWDAAIAPDVPESLRNRLGLAIGGSVYSRYRALLASDRWVRAFNFGARAQRLLWASTGAKDPNARDTLYIEGLVAPFTISTVPERTLKAFVDHGALSEAPGASYAGSAEMLSRFRGAGFDLEALASRLQEDAVHSFERSWNSLLMIISGKRTDTGPGIESDALRSRNP